MTIRILLLATLFLASLGWGKNYEACKDLTGPEKEICDNVEFSKERLVQNSDADKYAQSTGGMYNAPNANADGRSGATLLACDQQQGACVNGCKGDATCRDGCFRTYTQCAGIASTSSSPGIAPAEKPDGYTVEFNDEIAKTQ